jgi:hypothetical protein
VANFSLDFQVLIGSPKIELSVLWNAIFLGNLILRYLLGRYPPAKS